MRKGLLLKYSCNCIYFLYQGCALELQLACDINWDFIFKVNFFSFQVLFLCESVLYLLHVVEDLFRGHPISEKKLKEILGHTPLQVFAGACLGVLVGYLRSHNCSVSL